MIRVYDLILEAKLNNNYCICNKIYTNYSVVGKTKVRQIIPPDFILKVGMFVCSCFILLLLHALPVANLVANKSFFLDAFQLDASLCLQSKTLPQGSGEPIWHKNKKVS